MTYEQMRLKTKAKGLALAIVILQAIAIIAAYVLFLGQKLVFKYYFPSATKDGFQVLFVDFLLMISGAILQFMIYMIFFVVLSNSTRALKTTGIVFTVVNIVLSIFVFPILSRISSIFVGRFRGDRALGASVTLSSVTGLFTSPMTVVASALFFISCGFLIACDKAAGANGSNAADYPNF